MAGTLAAFQQCDRDTVKIDPMVLGVLHETIVGRVLAIYEALDEVSPEPTLNSQP